MTTTNGKWYIVQVISNYEQKVKEALENRVFEGKAEGIEKIFLPMMDHTTKTGIKKRKPMFPGYLFVKVEMTDQSWYAIRNTEYVTGIVGSAGQRIKPTPIPQFEIDKILAKVQHHELTNKGLAVTKVNFQVGDMVQITNGNFKDNFGKVKELSLEKQVALVEIEFFGRMTPVSVSLSHIKK